VFSFKAGADRSKIAMAANRKGLLLALALCVALTLGGKAAASFGPVSTSPRAPKPPGGKVWWKPWTWFRRPRSEPKMVDLSAMQFNFSDIPQLPPNRYVMDTVGLFSRDLVIDLHENVTELNESSKVSAYFLVVPHVPDRFDSLRAFAKLALKDWLGANGTRRHERAVLSVIVTRDQRIEIAVGSKVKRKLKEATTRKIARKASSLLKQASRAERARAPSLRTAGTAAHMLITAPPRPLQTHAFSAPRWRAGHGGARGERRALAAREPTRRRLGRAQLAAPDADAALARRADALLHVVEEQL
jgi:hypothetical protein